MQELVPVPAELPTEVLQKINKIDDINLAVQRVEAAQASAVPPDVFVNVQSAEAMQQLRRDDRHAHDDSGPLVKQFQTRTRECWRNIRDRLPGN